ncbi:MAG: type II secretion system protein [Alphaproteobacteria bacterium]
MNKIFKIIRQEEGFALVEVAIALIVMGIVLGVGLPSFLHYLEWQKIRDTKEKQEKILYSVASFVLQNGFVPLPADPHATEEDFGLAGSSVSNSGHVRGIVPFKTLGLPEEYARDGFRRYFTYIGGDVQKQDVDVSNQSSFCRTNPLYPLQVEERLSNGKISKRPTHLTEQNPIVLILLSHGESGYGAYQGTPGNLKQVSKLQAGLDKHQNAMASSLKIMSRGLSRNPQDFFDDMVVWVTRDNLMAFYGKSPCQKVEPEAGMGHGFI